MERAFDLPVRLALKNSAKPEHPKVKRTVRLYKFCDVLTLELRDSVHVVDQLDITRSLCYVSSREHPLLSSDHDFRGQRCDLAEESCIVYKAWYIPGYKAVHHAANSDDLACENPCINCCL